MCGIAGLLSPVALTAAQRGAVADMRTALRHRGPDDEGECLLPGGTAAFAHTRLAVFDRTAAGRQPMSVGDGRFTITYNGALYNRRELRRTLEQSGTTFRSDTDTEIILRLYERHGEDCVDRLRGMFAFAIWDAAAGTCFLARDQFGIKPLYYATTRGTMVFASEVRALLSAGVVADSPDPVGIYGFLRTGAVPEPHTMIRDVKCLPAGHCLTWSAERARLRSYWHLQFSPEPGDDPAPRLRAALLDSVERHCAADTPVGVFLSSGIDSSAILALAAAAGRRDLMAMSMSFPGTPDDESPIARRTAEHFGFAFRSHSIDAAVARDAYDLYVRAADQPSIDGLNTFVMARVAREAGVPVVLSGIGADEVFGGYPTFTGVPRLERWHRRLDVAGSGGAAMAWLATKSSTAGSRARRVADMLRRPPSLANAYHTYRGIFTDAEARTLVSRYLGVSGVFELPSSEASAIEPSAEDAVTRLEMSHYLRNQLLRDADVMGMASGVELRTPFLDADVMATLARIPGARRVERGKAMLRRAVPELPAWVGSDPKRCFQFPFGRWADNEWRDVFADVERDCPVATGTWYRKWCVSALRSWMSKTKAAAHV